RELEMARLKTTLGSSAGTSSLVRGSKNPPAEQIEGQIKRTDPTSGLVTLSVGGDSGLAKGHTLEVFRLSPSPRYLGTVRVIEVTPQQAVAQPVGRLSSPLQVGDKVASRILAGG